MFVCLFILRVTTGFFAWCTIIPSCTIMSNFFLYIGFHVLWNVMWEKITLQYYCSIIELLKEQMGNREISEKSHAVNENDTFIHNAVFSMNPNGMWALTKYNSSLLALLSLESRSSPWIRALGNAPSTLRAEVSAISDDMGGNVFSIFMFVSTILFI